MPVARKARTNDPYNLEARLERLIHVHLLDMEEHPEMYASKDRLSTIQYVSGHLNRRYGWGDDESSTAGSAVRRYAGAFKTKPENRPTRVTGGLAAVSDHPDEEDAA